MTVKVEYLQARETVGRHTLSFSSLLNIPIFMLKATAFLAMAWTIATILISLYLDSMPQDNLLWLILVRLAEPWENMLDYVLSAIQTG